MNVQAGLNLYELHCRHVIAVVLPLYLSWRPAKCTATHRQPGKTRTHLGRHTDWSGHIANSEYQTFVNVQAVLGLRWLHMFKGLFCWSPGPFVMLTMSRLELVDWCAGWDLSISTLYWNHLSFLCTSLSYKYIYEACMGKSKHAPCTLWHMATEKAQAELGLCCLLKPTCTFSPAGPQYTKHFISDLRAIRNSQKSYIYNSNS